jgi:hypothetical protein
LSGKVLKDLLLNPVEKTQFVESDALGNFNIISYIIELKQCTFKYSIGTLPYLASKMMSEPFLNFLQRD